MKRLTPKPSSRILQLTVHYAPNVGGVETHLLDLVSFLSKKHKVYVLAYRPLVSNAKWKSHENSKNLVVRRIPWFPGLFYTFSKLPILEFIYLVPGLLIYFPLSFYKFRPDVIHAHGIISGVVAAFWKIFIQKRLVISTHSLYSFPDKGAYRTLVKWVFKSADHILALSPQSSLELQKLGIDANKISVFTYWINLSIFSPVLDAKKKLGWGRDVTILFAGRLVEEKGLLQLLSSAQKWPEGVILKVSGDGPLRDSVIEATTRNQNIEYLGVLGQEELPLYYSAATAVIVPSTHEEGYGRVIIESLACGTPVLGSNRGAIPTILNEKIGRIFDVSEENILKEINFIKKNTILFEKMRIGCRKFAVERYGESNADTIVKAYE